MDQKQARGPANKPGSMTPGSMTPGSMTMAMRAVGVAQDKAEVIRLGIVSSDGRLDERTLSLSSPIVIGSQATASLCVPGLATPHVLVTTRDGVATLHVRASMKARVATLTGSREIEGRDEDVVLDPKSRGKLVIAGTTLLFQLAAAAPKRQLPSLPAAVRASWIGQIDMIFTALVACSFLGHFGFVVYLESADWPMTRGIDRVPDHVAELIFDDDPQPPDPPVETPDDETPTTDDPTPDDTTVADNDTPPTPRPDRPSPNPSPSPMSADEAALAVAEGTQAVTQLIGAIGIGSSIENTLAGGAPPVSQQAVFDQVNGGVDIATNTPMIRDRTGGGPIAGDFPISGMDTRPTGPRDEGPTVTEVGPRFSYHPPVDDDVEIRDGDGEFDQAEVVRMIQRRRALITACYEHAILSDPSLRGRVEIQMTIEENGSVSGVRTIENGMGSDVVSRCIETRVRGFRFTPGPTGGSVQFRFPFVFEQQR